MEGEEEEDKEGLILGGSKHTPKSIKEPHVSRTC